MEYQISYYTDEMIDSLILNSDCPKNSISIQISLEYAMKLVPINWVDIQFAVINNYFNIESAIEYAMYLIGVDQSSELIIELAGERADKLTKEEVLSNYIYKFVENASYEEMQCAKDKMLYIVMHYLYENKYLFENSFKVVEIVYDDFGFPEDIKKVVSYIPSENEIGEYDNLFYKNWREYLLRYKK